MVGGKLVSEWLLRNHWKGWALLLSCNGRSTECCCCKVLCKYGSECICHHFPFVVSHNQVLSSKRARACSWNSVSGQKNGTRRIMGPVSSTKVDTGWRGINRLFGLWDAHNMSSVDLCLPGPKSLRLFVDVGSRGMWLWPMAAEHVLLHSWTHPELARYFLFMLSVRATKEGFVFVFLNSSMRHSGFYSGKVKCAKLLI